MREAVLVDGTALVTAACSSSEKSIVGIRDPLQYTHRTTLIGISADDDQRCSDLRDGGQGTVFDVFEPPSGEAAKVVDWDEQLRDEAYLDPVGQGGGLNATRGPDCSENVSFA